MEHQKTTVKYATEFPYLNDKDIHSLKLDIVYRILSTVKATDSEVELIKRKRRNLQKSHFKQKKDFDIKTCIEDIGRKLSDLEKEKNELIKRRIELIEEIDLYKMCCN
ncbi:hypothetical protein LOD99_68 [Oopsacas minuta]|uniref:BZIP domain-containing protein n=1 Tax=Oopsacas minuta TaxID=111878 RepID=A0AAV7K8K3_9METZ|nr:hypothetical protein LOD99_68 [Oopsacas minuta]